MILEVAVQSLDGRVGQYYGTYLPFLTDHVMDPDLRKRTDQTESPRHYFDLEEYQDTKFSWAELSPTPVAKSGVLPWAILEAYQDLVSHLREQNYQKAAKSAADLAHYVGDMFQPLHTTRNHDGQLTNNHGIHKRYEISLAEGYRELLSVQSSPVSISKDGLEGSIMAAIVKNHEGVDAILDADQQARQEGPVGSTVYYKKLRELLMDEISGRMSAAASFLSALYRLSWEESGLPLVEAKALSSVGVGHE